MESLFPISRGNDECGSRRKPGVCNMGKRERCRGKVAEKRRERKKEKCVRERTGIRSANKSIIFFL